MTDTQRKDVLSAEREVELGRTIEIGLYAQHLLDTDPSEYPLEDLRLLADEGRAAFAEFVDHNTALAAWWARRRVAAHGAGGLDFEDLAAEGMLGIIRAVMKWDFTRGIKFSTYGSNWVRMFQGRAAARHAAVGLSDGDRVLVQKLLTARTELVSRMGRMCTRTELAAELDLPVKVIEHVEMMSSRTLSLSLPVSADRGSARDLELGDVIPATGDSIGEAIHRIDAEVLLDCLSQRERTVIGLLFGLVDGQARSVAESARVLGVTAASVSSTAREAMSKLQAIAHRPSEHGAAGVAA